MSPLEFIPHTKRRGMTRARAARIFLDRDGICVTCRQQIRQGQAWFIEHPEALSLGGSDDDADLWPAHVKCKAVKDASDAAAKAKRDRHVTASWDRGQAPKMVGRGFRQSPPQRTATRPIIRKADR